jgi:hypothetical protein
MKETGTHLAFFCPETINPGIALEAIMQLNQPWSFFLLHGLSMLLLAEGCSSEGTPAKVALADSGVLGDRGLIIRPDGLMTIDQSRPTPLCGDGFCDAVEQQKPSLCPQDCDSPGQQKKEPFSLVNPTSGATLWGNVYLPEDASATRRYPAMALVPGGTGDGSGFEIKGTTSELTQRGIIALTFDLDGRGKSGGTEDQCGHIHQDALKALIDYLAKRPEVDATRIGLFSSSFGITCASGALARHGDTLPVKFLVDMEGPANRNDTGHCDSSDTGHITHDCGDDVWWSEREASEHIKQVKVPYLRVQREKDHAQPDNAHAILMINNATQGQYGGQGVSSWTLVNQESLNQPNAVYSAQNPPVWLQNSTADKDAVFMEDMIKKLVP